MFKRPHHQRISEILERLNHELLMEHHCFFGGGTAIALLYEEYRESVDIDFLISDLEHYRALRDLLTGPDGIGSITHKNMKLALAREIRADQYGIQTVIQALEGAEKNGLKDTQTVALWKMGKKDQEITNKVVNPMTKDKNQEIVNKVVNPMIKDKETIDKGELND